jgi:hypothetical protein
MSLGVDRASLVWADPYPLYGLGDSFEGGRWVFSVSPGVELELGHGDPRASEGPQLTTGFITTPLTAGTDVPHTLGTRLLLQASEQALSECANQEQRQAAIQTLVNESVPALEWETFPLKLDERETPFTRASANGGNWVAYHLLRDFAVCVQAERWNLSERPDLVRILDLTQYLEGSRELPGYGEPARPDQ